MSYNASGQGTVAARIKAFQNVQTLEDLTPRFPKAPRASTQPPGPHTSSGHGQPEEDSFNSLNSRASIREGTEGVGGIYRPPMGTISHKADTSMEEKQEYKRPSYLSSPRPSTGLTARPTKDEDPLLTPQKLKSPRKHRSMENVAEPPQSELADIRARLKSVAEKKDSITMSELGDMIEYVRASIELPADNEGSARSSEQISGVATPKSSMVRRWRSARASHQSVDTPHERQFQHPPSQHRRVGPGRHPPEQHNDQPHGETLASSQLDVPRKASPVKERAAMFENLQQKKDVSLPQKAAPQRHLHLKETWQAVPEHEPTPEIEKGLHSVKFGRTIYDKSGTILAPRNSTDQIKHRQDYRSSLAAPYTTSQAKHNQDSSNALDSPTVTDQSTHHQDSQSSGGMTLSSLAALDTTEQTVHRQDSRSSGGDTLSFNTARQSIDNILPKETVDAKASVRFKDPSRRTSWMPPWRLFSKGSSAMPQATEDNVGASPEKDEHYPEARTSIIQSRVQDLLSAANQGEVHEYHMKRRPTPYPGKVTESEIKETLPSPASLEPYRLAPLQIPIQEEAEALQSDGAEEQETSAQYTPTRRSLTEKEVLDNPRQLHLTKIASRSDSVGPVSPEKPSPSKTAPSTPRRGRALRASLSPRGSGHAVEQAFVVSPGRSRSRSRASGSRMLVEVEVRDSPKQEARDVGQRIVFVRADVEDINEEEET